MSDDTPLKPRIDFTTEKTVTTETLREARFFEPEEGAFIALPESAAEEVVTEDDVILNGALRPRKTFRWRLLMLGVLIFFITVIARTGQWLTDAWQRHDWIALGGTVSLGLVLLAGAVSLVSEIYRLYRLRHRAQERDEACELLNSHGTGKAKPFCEHLAARSGIGEAHPSFRRWQDALQETHSDQEIMKLYGAWVQPIADKQAREKISRYAAESAVIIAVSPLAIADMFFIAWRNIRMINQIARIYGIELGYFSRIRLLRGVLFNIAFAGASELVREVGVDWMSQDLMGRLSARAAQGIGAGLLTARLGIKAMELCRPLPWMDDDKPRLGDFRTELFSQLRDTLKKKAPAREKAGQSTAG